MDAHSKLTLLAAELIRRNGGEIYKTKLFKLLYYCDFISQAKRDQPISGVVYKAWDDGPVPTILFGALNHNPEEFPALVVERGDTDQDWGESIHVNPQVPIQGQLSEEELQIVELVWQKYGSLSGAALIERTHLEAPWKITYTEKKNAAINYTLAYLEFEEDYSEDDGLQADAEKARELGSLIESMGAKIL